MCFGSVFVSVRSVLQKVLYETYLDVLHVFVVTKLSARQSAVIPHCPDEHGSRGSDRASGPLLQIMLHHTSTIEVSDKSS